MPPEIEGQQQANEENPQPLETDQQETVEEVEEEVDFSVAKQFLDGIEDPEILKQLDPYVRKWNSGVQRRFQEIHSTYAPYKELGELEEIQRAQQLYAVANSDPERLYNALAEALGKGQAEQVPPVNPGTEQLAELPAQWQERFHKMETVANWLAEQYQQSQTMTKQQQEDAALEEYMTNLHGEFGDFDDRYVLSLMLNGMSGEDAVKQFQSTVTEHAKKFAPPPAPQVLSGGGSVGQEPIDPGKLTNKDTQNLVASLMAQAAQEKNR